MSSLRELQREFFAGVFAADPAVLSRIRGHGLPPERRFAVYRNNTLLGLSEALRDGFPVVHRLVGTPFFDAMARRFATASPPRSGCLLDYGADFAGFIEAFGPADTLPYLPDVARLEWAWHESFHAPETPPFGFGDLAALSPEQCAGLRLPLQPNARLLASPWPVGRIFEVNQPGYPGEPSLDLRKETGCRLLVLRGDPDPALHPLSAGEFTLLAALNRDRGFESALEEAGAAEPGFDPATALARCIGLKVFSLPRTHD